MSRSAEDREGRTDEGEIVGDSVGFDIRGVANTPWRRLYAAQDDMAWVSMMGVSPAVFNVLLAVFAPRYDVQGRGTARGRKRTEHPADALGLFLHWSMLSSGAKYLSLIFGMTPSSVSRVINRAMDVLPAVLNELREADVMWPERSDLARFAEMVEARSGLLNVWGFVDGLSLPTYRPGKADRAWYNGWKHRYQCTNVFVFTPDGCIAYARFNYAGCSHDALLSERLFGFLAKNIPAPYRLVADTAFPTLNDLNGKIVTPLKSGAVLSGNIHEVRERIYFHQTITSTRQAAEWGMRAFQGMFPRLYARMPACHATRKRWLNILIPLFNFRTRTMGINQIRTVYSNDYEPSGADVSYLKVGRYYNIW